MGEAISTPRSTPIPSGASGESPGGLTDDPDERARRIGVLQHVEAAFEPLPFDAAAARSFGLATAALTIIGRKPGDGSPI